MSSRASWSRSRGAGAATAGYLLLRLPGEVRDLFYEWLETHYPDRANRVRNRIRELRGGRDNDPRFGTRMRGQGPWADLLRRRFEAACHRHGLEQWPRKAAGNQPCSVRQAARQARWNCGESQRILGSDRPHATRSCRCRA